MISNLFPCYFILTAWNQWSTQTHSSFFSVRPADLKTFSKHSFLENWGTSRQSSLCDVPLTCFPFFLSDLLFFSVSWSSSSSSEACPESEPSCALISFMRSSIAKGAWSITVLKMLLQMALKRTRLVRQTWREAANERMSEEWAVTQTSCFRTDSC